MQTTVATAIRRAETDDALGVALEEIAGQRGAINSRMLGRWIERMAGRIVGGKLFVRIGIRAGTLHWAVQFARKQPGENTPKPTQPATADADGPACGGKMVGLGGFVSDGLSASLGAAELATSDTEAF
jgi:hypothetical protein